MNRILSVFTVVLLFTGSVHLKAQISEIENTLFLKGSTSSLFLTGRTDFGVSGTRIFSSGTTTFIDNRGTGGITFSADNSFGVTKRLVIKSDGKMVRWELVLILLQQTPYFM